MPTGLPEPPTPPDPQACTTPPGPTAANAPLVADMDEKLDALGSAVGAMHEDVKRLAGRPFLEVYEEWTKRTLEVVGSKLPSEGKWASSTNSLPPIHHLHLFLF